MRVPSVFLFTLMTLAVALSPARAQVIPADARMDAYLPLLEGQRVGVVCNHTAALATPDGHTVHLVDTLIASGIDVVAAFGPEHGFRGDLPDGQLADDGRDPRTGIPVYSLYGTHKKPTADQLSNLDVVVYDIQDVGVRCYTPFVHPHPRHGSLCPTGPPADRSGPAQPQWTPRRRPRARPRCRPLLRRVPAHPPRARDDPR